MFLPVILRKFCKSYFNSYCKWYFWKLPFKDFPCSTHSVKIYLSNSRGGEGRGGDKGCAFQVKLQFICLPF